MKRSRESTRKNTKKLSQIKKYITNYQSSEAIIKSILDKIFILAFHEGYSKETDKNLGDYCYDYLKKEMTSFFELNFINYTNSNKNNKNNPEELLWEMETPKENTWVEIFEPESEPIDRYESAQILYQEIKRDINNQTNQDANKKIKKQKSTKKEYNKNTIKEVEEKSSMSGFDGEIKLDNGAIPEISGIENKSSGSLNATDAEIKKNIDNVDINNNIRTNEKRTTKRRSTKTLSLIQSTNVLPPVQKRSRNQIIYNYPSSDIPGIELEYNHQSLEPSNIEILRQEREELIKKKLIESQNEKIINKVKKINEDDKKPKKLFDPKHLTFDSNGKIINFHPFKLDKLQKEFTLIKNLIKGEPKLENIKSRRNKYKEKKQDTTKDNEEEKKMKEILIEKPIPIFEEKTAREKDKYIPSGSNFQIISPNIGVTIKENNRFKQGSKEFSKYFQKYSLRDYDKMLNDFVPLQNQTLLKNQLKKLNSSSSNDYLSTIQNNNISKLSKKISNNIMTNSYDVNMNNPLLKDAQAMNNSTNINNINQNINSSLSNNNNYLSSNFNNTINNNITSYKSLNTENSITMKKMGLGSLKLEIESLKDLSTINPSLLSRTNRIKNIFRYDSYKDYKKLRIKTENKINIFSELNKKIMISRDWGNDLGNKKSENIGFNDDNKRISRHISKQQILRELGSNILSGIKIKLPRDRKVDINDNNLL